MLFNINDNVRVKLTARGRFLLEKEHYEFYEKYKLAERPYTPYKEDEDGWSTWQLWHLMQYLGKYCTMGGDLPFETTIEIADKIPKIELPEDLFNI